MNFYIKFPLFWGDLIIHADPTFNGGLSKPPLKLDTVYQLHTFYVEDSHIHAIDYMLVHLIYVRNRGSNSPMYHPFLYKNDVTCWLNMTESHNARDNMSLAHLTHWGRDKIDAISQTTLSNAFSWMKMLEFRLKFHWSLFLRVQLTIFQHWFR